MNVKGRRVPPWLWEEVRGLLNWEWNPCWDSSYGYDFLGYHVPAVDQPLHDGVFAICFRGHPFLDPFETTKDGTVHCTPSLGVAMFYARECNHGTLPEGYGFVSVFETRPNQEFGQDWTLRNERPGVDLVRGPLDEIKDRREQDRQIKTGDMYETGVHQSRNRYIATFVLDHEQCRMARLNPRTIWMIRLLTIARNPHYYTGKGEE